MNFSSDGMRDGPPNLRLVEQQQQLGEESLRGYLMTQSPPWSPVAVSPPSSNAFNGQVAYQNARYSYGPSVTGQADLSRDFAADTYQSPGYSFSPGDDAYYSTQGGVAAPNTNKQVVYGVNNGAPETTPDYGDFNPESEDQWYRVQCGKKAMHLHLESIENPQQ
jgi:hypothetical protein